eukprot:8279820-Heterocapsa_arctica.AAC.1
MDPNLARRDAKPIDALYGVYGQAFDEYPENPHQESEAAHQQAQEVHEAFNRNFTKAYTHNNESGIIFDFIWGAKKVVLTKGGVEAEMRTVKPGMCAHITTGRWCFHEGDTEIVAVWLTPHFVTQQRLRNSEPSAASRHPEYLQSDIFAPRDVSHGVSSFPPHSAFHDQHSSSTEVSHYRAPTTYAAQPTTTTPPSRTTSGTSTRAVRLQQLWQMLHVCPHRVLGAQAESNGNIKEQAGSLPAEDTIIVDSAGIRYVQ